MPNDNQNTGPAAQSTVPSISPQTDLPPLPSDFSTVGGSASGGQNVSSTDQPITPPSGSSLPPNIPPVVTQSPKKKFGGGRVIATILGILLLVGGIEAGIYLTQQPQIFRSQAKTCEDFGSPKKRQGCRQAAADQQAALIQAQNNQTNTNTSYNPNVTLPYIPGGYTKSEVVNTSAGLNQAGWDCGGPCPQEFDTNVAGYYIAPNGNYYPIGINYQTGEKDTTGTAGGTPTHAPTPSPTPGAASCLNVKAYSSTWLLLTDAQLSALTAGTTVNFCVAGSTTNGVFDKAQFKINAVVEPETTIKRPGSNDFCQSYQIKSTDTTISVLAKIHNTISGWVGETF